MPGKLYDPVLSAGETAALELRPEELAGGWPGLRRKLRSNNPFEGSRVRYCSCLSGFAAEVQETGLRTPLGAGMTLACRAVRL